MSSITGPVGISVNPSVILVALVTLSTAIVFGLALLPRPSRATITWSAAFGIAMIATYVWVAAMQFDSAPLRAISSGLLVCFEPLLWLGVRFYAGKRPPWLAALAFPMFAPTVLVLFSGSEEYATVFRVVFTAAAVYAGLAAWELFRLRLTTHDVVLPLALVSCAFVVVAVVGLVAGVARIGSAPGDELSMLRDINGVGTVLTSQCASITIVLLARGESLLRTNLVRADQDEFGELRARLRRARGRQENSWSLLDVRLDDPSDLHDASGPAVYAGVVAAFQEHVRQALPASADMIWLAGERAIALLPGSEEAVRHHLRELLAHVSRIDERGTESAVRVSASIGWASVVSTGFDLDALRLDAAAGAEAARERGGDRWERASEVAATLGE
ncbi:hypothetical protein [uncultured Microbacterium sp.]|uniref:hypothetical protein n=1 Tax=uncultured Microbacterium sp. TaxID=191216 RepID=UPI0025E3D41A|nr:hypothetical protein [uncultured Microbacterium sp.]